MKLRRFLGAFTAFAFIASSVPAFAADSDLVVVSTPYDITSGEYTTDLVEGHVIAVPVDVQSTTDGLTSYNFELNYDTSVLEPAADVNDFSDDMWINLESITGSQNYDSVNTDDLNSINALGQKRGSNFNAYGTIVVNTGTVSDAKVSVVWYDTTSRKVNADTPELYIVFKVINSVDELNLDIFKIDPSITSISDTTNGKGDTINISNDITKLNACDGAFKIVVDGNALPYWVQGVSAVIDGYEYALDACVQADGTTEYSFPVRLTSDANEASVDVTIKATVSTDEAGSDAKTVEWGTVNVDMSGTATTYEATNPTLQ